MKFLDTNILLELQERLSDIAPFVISSVSLNELEDIKTNKHKTEEVRYAAREATRWLNNNEDKYQVIFYLSELKLVLDALGLNESPDNMILACASTVDNATVVTNDVLCRLKAKYFFNLPVESAFNDAADGGYSGFTETCMDEAEMAQFYENPSANTYGLLTNEYLIIKDLSGSVVDINRWDGEKFVALTKRSLESFYFQKLKPKDAYQQCAIDALMNSTICAISGKAGSGKSLLSLMAAMHLIEKGKYDRLVILFNPTKTRGASDMGFYGGSAEEKARQNSIGNILTTKFGDEVAIDLLLQQNKLKLVSMADCRGMEIRDNEILWITECQNTSIDLIKLCLSRVSSGAKVFIEGDYQSQVDSMHFEGNHNGFRRVIEVFKGHKEFGYVELQNVWRSKIAELCELL